MWQIRFNISSIFFPSNITSGPVKKTNPTVFYHYRKKMSALLRKPKSAKSEVRTLTHHFTSFPFLGGNISSRPSCMDFCTLACPNNPLYLVCTDFNILLHAVPSSPFLFCKLGYLAKPHYTPVPSPRHSSRYVSTVFSTANIWIVFVSVHARGRSKV